MTLKRFLLMILIAVPLTVVLRWFGIDTFEESLDVTRAAWILLGVALGVVALVQVRRRR